MSRPYTERHIFLLKKIISDTWNYAELREFFEFLKSVSVSYLRAREAGNTYISTSHETLHDIADDFMIDLFARDKTGFYVWQRYVEQNGFPNLETAKEFFRGIVIRKSRQGLDRLFWERDRHGWNNDRALTRIKDAYSYKVERNRKGKFLVHQNDAGKEMMQEEDFAKVYELYLRCANAPNISAIAEKMLESIEESPIYARVLSVSLLNKAIKHERRWAFKYRESNEYKRNGFVITVPDEKPEIDLELQKIAHKAIDNFCEVPRGEYEYWKMASVAKDYFDDCAAGQAVSMYDVLLRYYPGIVYQEFFKIHRGKIEYLMKIVRKSIRRYLFGKEKYRVTTWEKEENS